MSTYKVILTYQYTHEIEVEADSENEAVEEALNMIDDSNRMFDDHWYDSEAVEIN